MIPPSKCCAPVIAVVGSGPSALYATAELVRVLPAARVNLFDRLPTMGGLARYGVSPDHSDRRRMVAHYESLIMGSGRVSFYGGVHVGNDISPAELKAAHDAVIYACGSSEDQRLGIDGEDLAGSHPATHFVGWYNGHPDHSARSFNLDVERAVVIGNGNVALDVARMLLLDRERLAETDVAGPALDALGKSQVREVVVLGRRGPAESAFTTPELLELLALDEIDVIVENAEGLLALAETPPAIGNAREYALHLKLQLLRELAVRPLRSRNRRLVLSFLNSPLAIVGSGRVEALQIGLNRLVDGVDGRTQAQPTGRSRTLTTGLVLRSVGYRGTAVDGLPFDPARGTLPHRDGRVYCPQTGEVLSGIYVVGWQKRGPSGVMGSNKICAIETVKSLLQDLSVLPTGQHVSEGNGLAALLQRLPVAPVDYRDWKTIDRAEREMGRIQRRPRIRFTTVEAMRSALV